MAEAAKTAPRMSSVGPLLGQSLKEILEQTKADMLDVAAEDVDAAQGFAAGVEATLNHLRNMLEEAGFIQN